MVPVAAEDSGFNGFAFLCVVMLCSKDTATRCAVPADTPKANAFAIRSEADPFRMQRICWWCAKRPLRWLIEMRASGILGSASSNATGHAGGRTVASGHLI